MFMCQLLLFVHISNVRTYILLQLYENMLCISIWIYINTECFGKPVLTPPCVWIVCSSGCGLWQHAHHLHWMDYIRTQPNLILLSSSIFFFAPLLLLWSTTAYTASILGTVAGVAKFFWAGVIAFCCVPCYQHLLMNCSRHQIDLLLPGHCLHLGSLVHLCNQCQHLALASPPQASLPQHCCGSLSHL